MNNSSQPIGETVRRLRTTLGISQGDLADRSGIPTGTMSMIENDRVSATSEIIDALSAVLDCTPTYLRATPSDLLTGRPWLRAYADAPNRIVDQVVADSSTAIDSAHRLGLRFVPDVLPLFSGDANDDDDVEAFALQVRAEAGLGEIEVVRNAVRAAERLGCVVLPMTSELGRHLGLSTRVDGTAVIRVARPSDGTGHSVPGDRQRFTVAHELGHLALHHERRPPDSAAEAARIEKQAHRFAAAFLAPAAPLLDDLERAGGRVTLNTLADLKEIWGVAIKALVVRFQGLGVIDEDHARSLYKQISSRKWNKAEPVHVPNEESVWLSKAVVRKYGDDRNALAHASHELGLGQAYFSRWVDWDAPASSAPAEVITLDAARSASRPVRTEFDGRARVTRLPVR